MGNYRNILLITDPSLRETPGFRRAVRLARATGAELHVALFDHSAAISAVGLVSGDVMDLARRAHVGEREDWMRTQLDAVRAQGVRARGQVIWGTPVHERMLTKILELGPDLVIKDCELEPLLKRVLFTPVDWQLLRLCPAPLLIVSRGAEDLPRRIIAAVDPVHAAHGAGDLNDRIVQTALALALQCDAQLHLVHAFEGLPPVVPAESEIGAWAMADAYEQLLRLHDEKFREFAERSGVPPECRHLVYGPAQLALADFTVDTEADVLVLGTIQRAGIERLILGSTAERILQDLHCDVLAVKPEGFGADVARKFGMPAQAAARPRLQRVR